MSLVISHLLLGKDLRKIGNVERVVALVSDQESFDELFGLLFQHDRTLVMRAADAVEKITRDRPRFLDKHKAQILQMLHGAINNELQWHLAQLAPRLPLSATELEDAWNTLSYWAMNPNEGKIVRVNALQALFDFVVASPQYEDRFQVVMDKTSHEPAPSIQARRKKILREIQKRRTVN